MLLTVNCTSQEEDSMSDMEDDESGEEDDMSEKRK